MGRLRRLEDEICHQTEAKTLITKAKEAALPQRWLKVSSPSPFRIERALNV